MGRHYRRIKRYVQAVIRERYDGLFPDAAEVRLLEVLGGSTITLGAFKRDGRNLTIILSKGRLLRSENFRRVAYDNKSVLYMNDVQQAIVIQGYDYEHDVVRYFEQEERLVADGFRVRYIPQRVLESNPLQALTSVKSFIYA